MQKILRFAAIIYVIYLFLALVVITPALNILPHNYLRDHYDWTLETGWVVLNPFKLSLDVSDAALHDTQGEQVMGFSAGSINLSLATLWNTGWVLDAIKFSHIQLALARISEGKYNFSDLIPDTNNNTTPDGGASTMPSITIDKLDLQSDLIVLSDRARNNAYDSNWDGLHILAEDISTVATEGKPYSIDLKGEGGGTLHWEGKVSLAMGNSNGRLQIDNLSLRKLWQIGEPWLDFELSDGRLALAGNYTIDWADTFTYSIGDGNIKLSSLDILPKDTGALPDTRLTLAAVTIDGIGVDSAAKNVAIESLMVDNLAPQGWMNESQISLVDMFMLSRESNKQAESKTGKDDSHQARSADATEQLLVSTEKQADRSFTETAHEPEQPKATSAVAGSAQPSLSSKQSPAVNSDWTISLAQTAVRQSSLRWRSPFTAPEIMDFSSINATATNIQWPPRGDTDASLQLTVNGEATLKAAGTLALKEGTGSFTYDLQKFLLPWLDPSLPPQFQATVARGTVNIKGSAKLGKFVPLSVNLHAAIKDFGLRMDTDGGRIAGWDLMRVTGLEIDLEGDHVSINKLDIDGNVGRVHIKKDGTLNTSNLWKKDDSESPTDTPSDTAVDTPAWTFSLPEITITDGEIDFWDESLPIQFRTTIGGIEGEIRNMSSDTGASAAVDIKGTVDEYAPVALKGELSPFAEPLAIDLNLTFDSVDMAALSPYTGTYAGYAIDRGLLDLDLQYKLANEQLNGKNSIRIDKLKLGDKVESDKAVNLPLEMALAIMTDSNGVIDMKIPVSGDVASPNFELSAVILKAIVNTLTKIVTAPFSLLAELADSEEDLQRLSFTPGYADLGENNKAKLDTLVTALQQRPNLSLLITGTINQSADTERLQKDRLKEQLLSEGLSVGEVEQKRGQWEKAITRRYSDLSSNPGTSGETVREQYAAVYSAIAIPDEQLITLANDRAMSVKAYLLNDAGLEPNRAVLGRPALDAEHNSFSGVELAVQN